MARVFINHPVADYDKWRPVFDADKARRAASGVTDIAVLRDADDPNSIWIVGESDADKVEALLTDPDLGKVMQDAGVTAPPKWWISD
jgi:hypothetical protein